MNRPTLILTAVLGALSFATGCHADTKVTFRITGMDPANVMQYVDPDDATMRIGYIQSTEFSHVIEPEEGEPRSFEDGILYYSVMFARMEDGRYQMEISYDFASAEGISRGIRNRSFVDEGIMKGISEEDILQKAATHGDAFADVIYENFLSRQLDKSVLDGLKVFLTELSRDLLKSLPKDGVMIMRRWQDLTGGAEG